MEAKTATGTRAAWEEAAQAARRHTPRPPHRVLLRRFCALHTLASRPMALAPATTPRTPQPYGLPCRFLLILPAL